MRVRHRVVSRSSAAIRLSRASTTPVAGPRFIGLGPASSPRSRAARQVVRCEEYKPSRRSSAPTAPGVLHPSASRTIFRLYSTANRRRVAFAATSISGPCRACSRALISLRSLLALDTKLPGGRCLTHVGREGDAKKEVDAAKKLLRPESLWSGGPTLDAKGWTVVGDSKGEGVGLTYYGYECWPQG